VSWQNKVLKNYHKLSDSEWYSIKKLNSLQQEKFRFLCQKILINIPFYKNRLDNDSINVHNINLHDLKLFPIIYKKIIRDNFSDFINLNYSKKDMIKSATGGSSGEPLQFYTTKHSIQYAAALYQRGFDWCGKKIGTPHVKLWGAPTDVKNAYSNFKDRIWNYVYNMSMIDAFNASHELFEKQYEIFKNSPPAIIESYPNILYEFSKYLQDKGKDPFCIPVVISAAGAIYDYQREIIKKMISPDVFNRYGSREFGHIAQECNHQKGLHINMERFVVEVINLDEHGFGDILITDLENHAFPFIRYMIGDRGKISEKLCSCGRQSILFEKVVGRSLDIVITPSGRMISGEMFPHFFKDYPQVILGQVIQEKIDNLEIRFKLRNGASLQEIRPLINKIQNTVGNEMDITVSMSKELVCNPTGKYRPVINRVKNRGKKYDSPQRNRG